MKNLLAACFSFCCLFAGAQVYTITSYGAVGNGSTLSTVAIQAAIDSCFNNGGGVVRIPPGNFLTATVFLKSNVTLLIDSGATITGSGNTSDYPDVVPGLRSYTDNYPQRSVFYAEGQHNIAITGKGTFNGNGLSSSFFTDRNNRPYGFRFISCTNIRYEGVALRTSGFWMMHNQDVDTLVIKNVSIINQNTGNGDGLSIDGCRHVVIDSCTADCNDDALVIKTTWPGLCSDVVISNCVLSSYSRAIKIGTETNGAFSNIHISDITVQLSNTAPIAAKCGINLAIVDGGSMENVVVENVNMTGIKVPLMIRLGNRARNYSDTAAAPGIGTVRNLELKNITAVAGTNVTSTITGIPGHYASDIALRNIDITFPGGQPAASSGFVLPENVAAGPEATIFGDTIPASGLYLRHVDSVLLQNVCFHSLQYDYRPTIITEDVPNFDSLQVCIISSVAQNISKLPVFAVYPNPATGYDNWHIKLDEDWKGSILIVTDASGRRLRQQVVAENITIVSSQGFAKGVYFFTLTNPLGDVISARAIRQ
jgi:hypothetical protein